MIYKFDLKILIFDPILGFWGSGTSKFELSAWKSPPGPILSQIGAN